MTDLATAHVSAIKLLAEGHVGGIYNLGTGQGYSVREILAAIAAETARNVPFVLRGRRDGDPPILVASPKAAERELGFQPVHSDLATIVRSAWRWHCKTHPAIAPASL